MPEVELGRGAGCNKCSMGMTVMHTPPTHRQTNAAVAAQSSEKFLANLFFSSLRFSFSFLYTYIYFWRQTWYMFVVQSGLISQRSVSAQARVQMKVSTLLSWLAETSLFRFLFSFPFFIFFLWIFNSFSHLHTCVLTLPEKLKKLVFRPSATNSGPHLRRHCNGGPPTLAGYPPPQSCTWWCRQPYGVMSEFVWRHPPPWGGVNPERVAEKK